MVRSKQPPETRDGVTLSNLDQPLFAGADASKRDLIDYLDTMSAHLLPVLRDRPVSVVRVRDGQDPFMQKNLPKYTPDYVETMSVWSAAGQRTIRYAVGNDRPTLLWLGNQRAVEYHVTVVVPAVDENRNAELWAGTVTHLVLDIDPPEGAGFDVVLNTARLIRSALADVGLSGAAKTSGAKGIHVIVPIRDCSIEDAAAATRALAARAERLDPQLATTEYIKADRGGKVFLDATRSGGATVVAAYSPRVRPGAPVSFPLDWDDLDDVDPRDFTIRNVPALLDGADPWARALPEAQLIPADVIAEGHTIPVARVLAMHEGKRRKRERESPTPP